jgi:hypothetical protein
MKIQIEFDVDTDGLCPEDRLLFEDRIQTQILNALSVLHPGFVCICDEARYRYSTPEIIITGDSN